VICLVSSEPQRLLGDAAAVPASARVEMAMFDNDVPLYNTPILVVNANDGSQFTCTAYQTDGAHNGSQIRWKVTDSAGRDFVGPMYVAGESPVELQRRVAEWWDAYRLLDEIARHNSR